jgi:inorganic pyrophosphatase
MYSKIQPKNDKNEISVIIEISQNSYPVKYEVDKDTGLLCVDRFIPVSMSYPCNYGFIPNTLGGDGDPLDVMVISDYPIVPNAMIKCRAVGVIMMEDESGMDEKILAVPADKVAINYQEIKDVSDLDKNLINKIIHFFENYKGLEKNKWVKIKETKDRVAALEIVDQGINNLKNAQKNT